MEYLEQARDELMGISELQALWAESGTKLSTYRVEIQYREGAVYGDKLQVRSTAHQVSPSQLRFDQEIWKSGGDKAIVVAQAEVRCLDRNGEQVAMPDGIVARAASYPFANDAEPQPWPDATGDAAPARWISPLELYFEDTDHTGIVHQSNYLKYFERARQPCLGKEMLARLWEEDGIGWVVIKAVLQYNNNVQYKDDIEIRTRLKKSSTFRTSFTQEVWSKSGDRPMVEGEVELCNVSREGKLIKVPPSVKAEIKKELARQKEAMKAAA
uniref:Thioesterase domain-containing protein n=1 Tax=Eutreptiella gymnastica TaxID=73025 RepID=A0A7S1HSF0_9EUGL